MHHNRMDKVFKLICPGTPLQHVSSFVSIKNTLIDYELYSKWGNFLKALNLSFSHAPIFKKGCTTVEKVLLSESEYL